MNTDNKIHKFFRFLRIILKIICFGSLAMAFACAIADINVNIDQIVFYFKVFTITLAFAILKDVLEHFEGPGDDGL